MSGSALNGRSPSTTPTTFDAPWYVIGAEAGLEAEAFVEIGERITLPADVRKLRAALQRAQEDLAQRELQLGAAHEEIRLLRAKVVKPLPRA
jgi:hypothetical protein